MPEGNEQPALLGDESEKKPKRTRSAPGSSAKRTSARKGGGRKPTKSNDEQVGEPSQGQLLETANRPSDQRNSERTAVDGLVRHDTGHSVAEDQASRSQERPVGNHRTNVASEVNEIQELAPAENGRHRPHSEITVEQPKPEPVYGEGLIEVSGKGFGFLRDPKRNYVQSPQDIFVTPEVVRKHALRDGLWIKGEIRRGSRGPQLFKLTEINGEDPERYRNLPVFEELTSINPTERIRLETVPDRYTTRVMDLMTPIGKGQRGLIVAPPRTGKTTLLQHIADAVVRNHPETSLIILLVTRIAQLAIERAKRLVEANRDVFVLMDSLTRVGRAFNNASAGSGRTMSGGMDSRAMEIPRKLFAAARNTEEAGSLTIMATALIETGSKMDELIFQEFKGTGNMEMVLDRQISDQRTYPSVDIFKSGTRREELLLPQRDLEKINTIRRGLAGHRPTEAIERLLSFLRKFPTNAQMLREIPG